jgi:hypothetical protein
MFPDAKHLDWLSARLDPGQERPFIAYHAAVALLEAVISLSSENCAKLGTALARLVYLDMWQRTVRSRLE